MKNRYTIILLLTVVCAAGLTLIGIDSTPPEVDRNGPLADAKPAETAAIQAKQSSDEKTDELADSTAEDQQEIEPELQFEPPFPDRISIFQAPRRQGRNRIQQSGQSEAAIELLGFVNVDGPRVALSFDGHVKTAAEGESYFGIEVISIQPPAVVLQRGRQRWQATFDN